MLNGLLNRSAKIAVLAGAGISLDSPSNLLDGWNFMYEALRRAAPADVDAMLRYPAAKLKEAETWRKSWVLSILDLPATKYRRPGERLRFETVHRRKDGSLKDVEVMLSLVEYGGKMIGYSYWRNI